MFDSFYGERRKNFFGYPLLLAAMWGVSLTIFASDEILPQIVFFLLFFFWRCKFVYQIVTDTKDWKKFGILDLLVRILLEEEFSSYGLLLSCLYHFELYQG